MAAASPDRSRRLAVGGLGVVALFFAATRMLGGGAGDPFESWGQGPMAPTPPGALSLEGSSGATPTTHDHGEAAATELRDPFCPLVAPAGTPAVPCPTAPAAPVADIPPVLLDVFADGGHDHARVRLGSIVVTVHAGEAVGAYRVVSLAGDCGHVTRNGEQTTLCVGDQPPPGR